MADWLVYWKEFADRAEPREVKVWRVKQGSRLVDAQKGDRLWLIVSGESWQKKVKKLKIAIPDAGYLAEIFTVGDMVVEDDGYYYYLIEGIPAGCVAIDPPLDVDAHLRAISKKPDTHVGMRCQTPRIFEPLTVDAMKNLLQRSRPGAYKTVFNQ
jgi:hypothetical protein